MDKNKRFKINLSFEEAIGVLAKPDNKKTDSKPEKKDDKKKDKSDTTESH